MDIERLKMTIAEKLREIREETSLSQEDVAKQLGVTTGAYGSFERAKNLIALNYLIDLSRIFQKPITHLLPGHVVMNSERNDPMLDPNLSYIVSSWHRLPQPVQVKTRELIETYLDLLDAKQRGEPPK